MLIVRYSSTCYWDWLSGPMPIYTRTLASQAEALRFICDPSNEVKEVTEVIEGEFRSEYRDAMNKILKQGVPNE